MDGYIVTGLISAAGSYAAVWTHLKFFNWRLNEQKEMLQKHDTEIRLLDKKTSMCKNCGG